MKKAAYIIAGLAVLALGGYLVYYERNKIDRAKAILIIEAFAGKKFIDPSAYDEGFLLARAKAIVAKENTFDYNGKMYSTVTSLAVRYGTPDTEIPTMSTGGIISNSKTGTIKTSDQLFAEAYLKARSNQP